MELFNLDKMIKGWFVGDFVPSAYKTDVCEVAVKNYFSGDYEPQHYHLVATEITVVLNGKVKMCDKIFCEGDIIVLSPGERTSFTALTDAKIVVVKTPGAKDDKYFV